MKTIKIALAQINPTVGGIEGNVLKICDYIQQAREKKSSLVIFPELSITGYPPEDLLLKRHFIDDNLEALNRVIENTKDIAAVVGFVDRKDSILYNAAAIIQNCKMIGVYHKVFLPNYGVFDEYRYFRAGTETPVYNIENIKLGVNICEDIWYPEGPAKYQAIAGAEVILNINASPYHMGKAHLRERMISERASDNKVVIAYLNTVGGQDELVFDGGSFIADKTGKIIVRGRQFEEEMIISEIVLDGLGQADKKHISPRISSLEEEVYKALVLGTRDYVIKNDFKQAVIGLSGGLDSSLVAAIAVDAIGKENVSGIFMPSPYTSKESSEDVYELARSLGIKIIEAPISNIFEVYRESLKMEFKGLPDDKTEENLQARIRGNILMAFSNKFGWL
ncbi:MAG: NAD+ synthase, partial [Nitrospirota bacterium]